MSLIELMVAAVILGGVIFGIFLAFSTSFLEMANARDRTVATNYAREKMEEIKNKPFEDIIGDPPDDPPTDIPGTKFQRKVTVVDSIVDQKEVNTIVRWKNRKDVYIYVELVTLIYNLEP